MPTCLKCGTDKGQTEFKWRPGAGRFAKHCNTCCRKAAAHQSKVQPRSLEIARLLKSFWNNFRPFPRTGGRWRSLVNPDPEFRLRLLIELADAVAFIRRGERLNERRRRFKRSTKHDRLIGEPCFVCQSPFGARHHIIQLQHGGSHGKSNLLPLCDDCHAKIHPWLAQPDRFANVP